MDVRQTAGRLHLTSASSAMRTDDTSTAEVATSATTRPPRGDRSSVARSDGPQRLVATYDHDDSTRPARVRRLTAGAVAPPAKGTIQIVARFEDGVAAVPAWARAAAARSPQRQWLLVREALVVAHYHQVPCSRSNVTERPFPRRPTGARIDEANEIVDKHHDEGGQRLGAHGLPGATGSRSVGSQSRSSFAEGQRRLLGAPLLAGLELSGHARAALVEVARRDVAAVGAHQPAGDRQAEARSAAGAGLVAAVERCRRSPRRDRR